MEGSDSRIVRLTLATIVGAFVGLIGVGLLVSGAKESRALDGSKERRVPAFVTSATCAECHAQEYDVWKDSHHGWALREPTEASMLGDFNDAGFEHGNVRSRFFRRDGSYYVRTDGPDGAPADFEIKYAVGVTPLQQYLVELKNGALQALDIAWDTNRKRWFHLYPDEDVRAGNGLHWSGPYKNWQARCAGCHQTDFQKGYSPSEKSYKSRWSELTVGCETCHGPGSAHVSWARDPASFASSRPPGVDKFGLAVQFKPDAPAAEIQTCAPCHSRRGAYDADSPLPGSEFDDHYRLARLGDALYHADGQIDGEVYVFGSFLQSKMYARGVRCSNCHEPHSGALRASGNAVCAQCHSPAGNPDFPTLRKTTYDDPSHHHHEAGSEGAQCVSCHMPAKTYMRVDPRRDHSFRVPRPDLTQKIGTPNACTGCHDDKSASWAAAAVGKWFPSGYAGRPHFGEALHAGRLQQSPEATEKLIELALDGAQPAIARATALDLLRITANPNYLEKLSPLLKDKSSLVRSSVLPLFQKAGPEQKMTASLSLIDDPSRSVRLEAAKLLLGAPLAGVSDDDRKSARRAIDDLQSSLVAQADYPETQMQIAGVAMTLRRFEAAQAALKEAVALDPQLANAWTTLARIQWALQRPDQAIATLESATKKLPRNSQVFFQLGALYLQQREPAKAISPLERCLKLEGPSPALLDMLALSHMGAGNLKTSRQYADRLAKTFPAYRPSAGVQRILRMPQ